MTSTGRRTPAAVRSRNRWGARTLVGGVLLVGAGCVAEEVDHREAAVMTEHRFLEAERASLATGESCVKHGASGCVSGFCFHYRPDPDDGYVCTKRCKVGGECPTRWSCRAAYPGIDDAFCVPPSDWVPGKAE